MSAILLILSDVIENFLIPNHVAMWLEMEIIMQHFHSCVSLLPCHRKLARRLRGDVGGAILLLKFESTYTHTHTHGLRIKLHRLQTQPRRRRFSSTFRAEAKSCLIQSTHAVCIHIRECSKNNSYSRHAL